MSRLTLELRSFIIDSLLLGEGAGLPAHSDDGSVRELGATDRDGIRNLVSYLQNKYGVATGQEKEAFQGLLG